MEWLERINWQDHDGVNLRMLNDVVLINPKAPLEVEHNLITGDIEYRYL